MHALSEIGITRVIKYVLFVLIAVLFKCCLFSPMRVMFLRMLGASIGGNTVIHSITFFNMYYHGFKYLTIGKNCFLGDETMIDLADKVILDDHVTLSNRVTILTHTNVGYQNHPLQQYFPKIYKKVHIKSGTFIGTGTIILPGVTVEKQSFAAAGSVITKNVPYQTLVAGVPAKVIRKITL